MPRVLLTLTARVELFVDVAVKLIDVHRLLLVCRLSSE